jgi:aspartyl-tRNA(Asn)/glutamyl-tRNA(Gln) amidotransferase subunit A
MNPTQLTIAGARAQLDAKEISAVELLDAHLQVIKEKDAALHAYLEIFQETARTEAIRADESIQKGTGSVLTGIPLAFKDNILIQGHHASGGSKVLETYVATYDAGVTDLIKASGAVILGRTNMDEFALGSSTENSAYGPTHNPHDVTRVPGGTSGGSAAAVAAHMALGALGSDTGGSIRQPAAFCGVVGLKMTYGSVSRYGLIAAASSLDQIGPIGKTVEDVRILSRVIRGHDVRDNTSLAPGVYPKRTAKKRLGIPRAFLASGCDPDVLAAFEQKVQVLKDAGYEIVDLTMPSLAYSLSAYYIINPAEVSSNLSRLDGIRYGYSSKDAADFSDIYQKNRGESFGKEARRRILLGTFVLSSGYVDAYYRKALAVRDMLREDFAKQFETVDAILTPTTPTPAFVIGEKEDPLAMYAGDIFTVPINLAGVPALSVPMGTVARGSAALPVGMQLIGAHGQEEMLCDIALVVERATA